MSAAHAVIGSGLDYLASFVIFLIWAERREAGIEILAKILWDCQLGQGAGQSIFVWVQIGILTPIDPVEAEENTHQDEGYQADFKGQAGDAR